MNCRVRVVVMVSILKFNMVCGEFIGLGRVVVVVIVMGMIVFISMMLVMC